MGGKTKQSQRTKNNVRPSSSGRSAELLSAARLEGGLGGGKLLPTALFPTLAAPLDSALNPDLALCLKKLNKKDPITKTKALAELCELVRKSDVEDVVAALGSWAYNYRALTTDTDHKVREAAQTAHGVVVGVCGRRIAPQLKALLPPWLQAQYDEYPPAAAAARASLQATFPSNKLPDVISFCMAEVSAHLLENLVGNGAEATLSKRILTPEEKELQWSRLVTASLQGLEYFVQHLPPAHDAWLWAELAPVLAAGSFWKMASHKSQQVRASWYGALGRMIGRFGDTFGAAHGRRTAKLLLGAGAPTAQLWACLLLLMRHVKDTAWLEKKDLLIKRIIDVLENGGWGDAKQLASMLLPLLAYIPPHMLTQDFYQDFFNAVFKGLEKKNVLSSKSERQAWITSLSECLRYLTLQQGDYVVEVATAVHRTWLERILAPEHDSQTSSNLVKHSATSMAALVKYWLKQSKDSAKYDQLVRNFWQNVASTMVTQIDRLSTERNEISALVDSHILLLQTLKTSFSQDTKKVKSIKFDDEQRPTNEESVESTQEIDVTIVDRYKHNLDNVVEKITAQYFEFACKKQVANTVLSPLLTLLIEFNEKNLFIALARHFDADSVYSFYDKVLRDWLASDTMRCRAVVDIVFLLMKHLSENEQDVVLDSFKQFPPSVVEWCISLSLSHPHCGLASVRRWLRGSLVEATLSAVCRRMIHEDDGGCRGLLLMCLATDNDGEMMISPSTVSAVTDLVCAALGAAPGAPERLAGAACALASELAGAADCTRLALALFRLQLTVQRSSGRLQPETWCEVRGAWQDAGAAAAAFRRQAVAAVRQMVTSDTESLDIPHMEHLASLCPYLLPQFGEAQIPDDTADAATLLRELFDEQDDTSTSLEVFALRHDCIRSRLNCPLPPAPRDLPLTARAAAGRAGRLVFRGALLRTLLLHRGEGEEGAWGEELLRNEAVEEEVARLLRDYAVVCSLHDGYAFWPHFDIISRAKTHLSCAVEGVTSELTSHSRRSLRARLARHAAEEGHYWSLAKVAFDDSLREKETEDEKKENRETSIDGIKLEEIVTGNGFFHTLQAESRLSADPLAPLRAKYLVMLRSFYLAHAHEPDVIDETFISEAAAGVATDPTVIVNAYYRHQHTMLYDSDIATADWRQVVSNAAVAEYLAEMVTAVGWEAAAPSWDFATISLCSLVAALRPASDHVDQTQVAMLACSVLKLYLAVHRFVGSVRCTSLRREPAPHVAELPTEWKDIFAPDLHYNLFSFIMELLGAADAGAEPGAARAAVLRALLPVAAALDWHELPQLHQNGGLSVTVLSGAAAAALSATTHHGYKYLAHALLTALAKPLVLHDAEKLAAWSNDDNEDEEGPRLQLALAELLPALTRLHELVDTALNTLKVGEETCEMVPFTDSHSVALGYLLLADAVFSAGQLARGDLVHHYLELCREGKHAEGLVACALRLVPGGVAAHAHAHAQGSAPPQLYTPMFLDPARCTLDEPSSSLDVGRLGCRALYHLARWAGGALRGWWGAAAPAAARALERALRGYVSPALVREQLQAVSAAALALEDVEVAVHWSTNEAVCTYLVEERALELSVSLGAAHPLPPPLVRARGGPQHNTHWLAVYLAYQNGTVLNALRMWMDTVAKRVEASPQCYICYCRLHPSSGRLPKVVCHQCRNKFHSDCLRKWFTTSSKSNCPLCRSNF